MGKSHAPRTDHAESAERARARLHFHQTSRDMLDALRVWIATQPDTSAARQAAHATITAIWHVARGYAQPDAAPAQDEAGR